MKGTTGTFSNMCGIFTPLFVAALTEDRQTIQAWNEIFYISAAIYVFGALVFYAFGRTSVQPWNTYWVESPERELETPPFLTSAKADLRE